MIKFKYFDYHERVKAVQKSADENMQRFNRRTYAYAYFGILVALLFFVLYGLGLAYSAYQFSLLENPITWGIVSLILLGEICALAHAMFFTSDAPQGLITINKKMHEELHRLTDELSHELDCPRIQRICVSFDMNAGLYQKRLFTLFPRRNHTLILGLPLLSMITSGQLRSVIGHELGHLKKHSRTFWLNRLGTTWVNIMNGTAMLPIILQWPLKRFGEWYLPRFQAHLSVLRRRQEFEADEIAVSVTNRAQTASALRCICVAGTYVDKHLMERLHEQMLMGQSNQRFSFYNHFISITAEGARSDLDELYTRHAMLEKAGPFDVHPSLSDRLAAIGATAEDAQKSQRLKLTNPAQKYLHKEIEEYVKAYDYHTRRMLSGVWDYVYQSGKISQDEINRLTTKYNDVGFKNTFDLYQTAVIYEDLGQKYNALKFYEEALERCPENRCLRFAIAHLKLRICERSEDIQHTQQYAEMLEQLVKETYRFKLDGMLQLHEFYIKSGEGDRADTTFDELLKHIDQLRDEYEERAKIRVRTKIAPHDLGDNEIESMRLAFKAYDKVSKVYLVQRKSVTNGAEPEYILAFKLKWVHGLNPNIIELLKESLAARLAFYGDIHVHDMNTLSWIVRSRIKHVCRKAIYKRR